MFLKSHYHIFKYVSPFWEKVFKIFLFMVNVDFDCTIVFELTECLIAHFQVRAKTHLNLPAADHFLQL